MKSTLSGQVQVSVWCSIERSYLDTRQALGTIARVTVITLEQVESLRQKKKLSPRFALERFRPNEFLQNFLPRRGVLGDLRSTGRICEIEARTENGELRFNKQSPA